MLPNPPFLEDYALSCRTVRHAVLVKGTIRYVVESVRSEFGCNSVHTNLTRLWVVQRCFIRSEKSNGLQV